MGDFSAFVAIPYSKTVGTGVRAPTLNAFNLHEVGCRKPILLLVVAWCNLHPTCPVLLTSVVFPEKALDHNGQKPTCCRTVLTCPLLLTLSVPAPEGYSACRQYLICTSSITRLYGRNKDRILYLYVRTYTSTCIVGMLTAIVFQMCVCLL